MTNILFRALAVAVLLISAGPSWADRLSQGDAFKQFMSAPDNPIILRGDYFKATLVAYQDFAKLQGGTSKPAKPGESDRLVSTQREKIENYDMSIDQTSTSYIVQIGPSVRDPSHVVMGGGARYTIDKQSFAIVSRTLLK